MKKRIFLWGLSNGIIALAIAALFWLGLGLGPHAGEVEWYVDVVVMVAVYGSCAACIWGAMRLRRRSGFKREDLKPSDPHQRSDNRKTVRHFMRVVSVQTTLVILAVIACWRYNSQDLLWSLIALIVSLHFIPLGKIFGVITYYHVGIIGSIFSVFSFAPLIAPYRMVFLGLTMGTVMLASAMYLIWKAEEIALKSVTDSEASQGEEETRT
jgi:hypothetical protein